MGEWEGEGMFENIFFYQKMEGEVGGETSLSAYSPRSGCTTVHAKYKIIITRSGLSKRFEVAGE